MTGASSGIGKQLALDLFKYGSKVILAARSTEILLSLRDEMKEMMGNCGEDFMHEPKILTMDLEKLEIIPSKAEEALSLFGHVDILVNNAGMSVRGGCLETELAVFTRLMNVNFLGVVELTRCLVPGMLARPAGGHVVVVSSVQGRLPVPHRAAYTASKHAVQAWADSLRAELSHTRVAVTVISPGYVDTNLSRNALTGSGARHGQLDAATSSGYSVQRVSGEILAGVVRGEAELVLAPLHVRLAILVRTLLPGLYRWIMARRAAGERNKRD